jgi:xanthine dehydrogenase accessory factor
VTVLTDFLTLLAQLDAVLVSVQSHRGSVPREAGAWMAVFADDLVGSIGGGHLEWQATAAARAFLQTDRSGVGQFDQSYALGPSLGQCCGGSVQLRFERVTRQDVTALALRLAAPAAAWPQVALFGGGHVGRALVQCLGHLPLNVRWIDSRDEIFPPELPAHVTAEHSDPVQASVAELAPGALVLIMSFSHAQDLEVVAACLLRQRYRADLAFVGLIGSRTKWTTFSHRLQARGFSPAECAQVTCPIGVPGIIGKEPEVIAVAVAAQVLQVISKASAAPGHNPKDA